MLIIILGPTASGKTRLAVQVAHQLGGEIISADSRQVYRGMDIGTGKDLSEYRVDGQPVPYHLIDVVDAGEDYNLHRYQQDFHRAVADIESRGRIPIVCGGTGLYIEAVLKGHAFTAIPVDDALRVELETQTDAELFQRFTRNPSPYTVLADTSTRKRLIRAIEIGTYLNAHPERIDSTQLPTYNYQIFGVDLPLPVRRQRITKRLHERLNEGMVDEVEQLLLSGVPANKLVFYGLEYKFITQHLTGELAYIPMTSLLETAIHQFAKRQMTFFRKMERTGLPIQWLDGTLSVSELADKVVASINYKK